MVPDVSGPARTTLGGDAVRLLVDRVGRRDPDAWEELYRRSRRGRTSHVGDGEPDGAVGRQDAGLVERLAGEQDLRVA